MRYWPFLTGRVRRAGHRVIVAPDLLGGEQAQALLGRLPAPGGGFPSGEDEILRCVVHQPSVGPLTVFYRVVEASAEGYGIGGEGALHDQYGRPILVTEGIVVAGPDSEDLAPPVLRAALHQAHTLVTPAFRDFWEQEDAFGKTSMAARHLPSPAADDGPPPRLVDMSGQDRPVAATAGSRPPGPAARSRSLSVLVVVLLGLVSGVLGWVWWPPECGTAASAGIRLNSDIDAECIGVTDGSYLFNDPDDAADDGDRDAMARINAVQQMIADENRYAVAGGRYVKVVLLMPLTVSRNRPDLISLNQILHSLQGTYTALHRANHPAGPDDAAAVRVQLLLANQGSRQEAAPEFLDSVLDESVPGHPVVAVVGLGSGVPGMRQTVDYLARHHIPMVSAVAAADSPAAEPLLWSVAPGATDYASALVSFLDQQNTLRSGVVVHDRSGDLYTRSLRNAFHARLQTYLAFPDQGFQGTGTEQAPDPRLFSPVVTNLCTAEVSAGNPLDMVFYAGRSTDFPAFAEALEMRPCATRPLTVLTGEPGLALSGELARSLTRGNVRVVAATASDPAAWVSSGADAPPGFAAFLTAYRGRGFVAADLADGYAVAHHDALFTALRAIRLAGEATPAPTPETVAAQFGQLGAAQAVQAASGTLSFPPQGGRAGGLTVTVRSLTR